jgi:glycosyltransferase involved in cell wall biosynthesis
MLSHSPNNPHGGASRVFHLLAQGLEGRGHIVTLQHFEDMTPVRNRTASLISSRLFMPKLVERAGLREDASQFDVVVSPSGMGNSLYTRLRKRSARPLLVNLIHGLTKFDHAAYMSESEVGHWPVSLAYRTITGPTQIRWDGAGVRASDVTVVQNLRDLGDVSSMLTEAGRVAMIPPAIHPELLDASDQVPSQSAREAGRLLWFGTWEARKGAHYIPRALREIRSMRPDVTLTLGGTGRSEQEMLALFDQRDRHSIRVLGRISNDEQADVFRRSSIFLFPSLSEGFGLALAEAMSFGLAAVTTSTAFGGDFLSDSTSAKIVPPTSLHIARAVEELLADEVRRESIAAAGRDIARTFTVSRTAASYELAFQEGLRLLRGRTPAVSA